MSNVWGSLILVVEQVGVLKPTPQPTTRLKTMSLPISPNPNTSVGLVLRLAFGVETLKPNHLVNLRGTCRETAKEITTVMIKEREAKLRAQLKHATALPCGGFRLNSAWGTHVIELRALDSRSWQALVPEAGFRPLEAPFLKMTYNGVSFTGRAQGNLLDNNTGLISGTLGAEIFRDDGNVPIVRNAKNIWLSSVMQNVTYGNAGDDWTCVHIMIQPSDNDGGGEYIIRLYFTPN